MAEINNTPKSLFEIATEFEECAGELEALTCIVSRIQDDVNEGTAEKLELYSVERSLEYPFERMTKAAGYAYEASAKEGAAS